MDFLQKLDFMMKKYSLNKRTLSQNSGIPYTTIDGWYKKGYEGMKISTLRILASYFNTVLDFWIQDDITDPNYGKNAFSEKNSLSTAEAAPGGLSAGEQAHIKKYRSLDPYGKEAVDSILDIEHKRCAEAAQAAPATTKLYIAARDGSRMEVEVDGEITLPDEDADIPE